MIGLLAALAVLAVWWFGFRDAERSAEPIPEGPFSSPPDFDTLQEDPPPARDADGPALGTEGAPTTPPDPSRAAAVEGDTVTGRVLDDRRRPVEGARVTLIAEDIASGARSTAITGADGSYSLEGLPRAATYVHGLVRARDGERIGEVALTRSAESLERTEADDIILGPSHGFGVRVTTPDGAPIAGARVLLEATVGWSRLIAEEAETDERGRHRFDGLAAGGYRVLAAAEGHARGATVVRLPLKANAPVELALAPPRELVALVVDKANGEPVADAVVFVDEHIEKPSPGTVRPWLPEPPPLRTDATGRVSIPGLGADAKVQLAAEAEGFMKRGNSRVLRSLPLDQREARIELQRTHTVRWPLAEENPLAPPDGTELLLGHAGGAAQRPLPARAWIEGGELVATDCAPQFFHAIATAPDGSWAQLFYSERDGFTREVTFMRPRRVTVRVQHADGSPAAGLYVTARNQGNMTIVQPTRLDAQGEAVLEVTYQWLIDLFVSRTPAQYAGIAIGSIDMAKTEDGTVEATLPAIRHLALTVRISGEPRLPTRYSLSTGCWTVREEPERGLLVIGVSGDASKEKSVVFTAAGFLPSTIRVPPGEAGATTEAAVTLGQGGSLLLRMKPPADGKSRIAVVTEERARSGLPMPPGGLRADPAGTEDGWTLTRYAPLAPGTYEVIDSTSNARSGPIEVQDGKETIATLDLSRAGMVQGRLVVPAGFETRGARVWIHREGQHEGMARARGAYVRADGSFRIRVPGNRRVTLRAHHPLLIPAAEGGSATVTTPREGVEIRMEAGATASLRLEPPFEGRWSPAYSPVHVLLYAGAVDGKADHDLPATQEGDVIRVGGAPAGTYTVVVDVQGRAPAILGKRTLDAQTDLGVVRTQPGATLVIRLQLPEGQDPPRITARATRVDGPTYTRYTSSRGEAEVRLSGLGAGTFTLHASTARGVGSVGVRGNQGLEKTITSDGTSEIVVEMDLR